MTFRLWDEKEAWPPNSSLTHSWQFHYAIASAQPQPQPHDTIMAGSGSGFVVAVVSIVLLVAINGVAADCRWPIVKQGVDTLQATTTVQYLLTYHRYTIDSINGVCDAQTTAQIKAFQRDNRLSVDGIVGKATWEALVVNVQEGDSGAQVSAVQYQLRSQYHYNLSV
jgi:peptidoglycan hydrolase-like protein with peptidoglycan-binding domain